MDASRIVTSNDNVFFLALAPLANFIDYMPVLV